MVSILINQSSTMKLSFPQWFKLRRNMFQLTQAQIAKELGVKPTAVSNWEQGVSKPALDPNQTEILCSLLRVELSELAKGFRGEYQIDE